MQLQQQCINKAYHLLYSTKFCPCYPTPIIARGLKTQWTVIINNKERFVQVAFLPRPLSPTTALPLSAVRALFLLAF
jgi:hypothetical protein